MVFNVLALVLVILIINKYCGKIVLHIVYGIMLKRENKMRRAKGYSDLPYNLPFEKEEDKEE